MWRRIREILKKEFRQVLREPRMRVVLFVPPLLQLIIFGYAVNLDVEHSRIAWMDQDRTPESRELLAAFAASDRFRVVATPGSEEEVQELLDGSGVQMVVRVLPGFGRDVQRGETASVQVLVDGTNSNTASIVAGYAGQVIASFGNRVMHEQQDARLVGQTAVAGGPVNTDLPVLQARTRVWFNPDLLSRNYFVPGVVVNIISLVTLMLTALAIVREREIGTMEQLMVTPIRPIELILGKTLPFAIVGLLDLVLITTAALLVFQIPFRGNPLILLLASVLFLLTTLGVGLFISTISQTQQQAMMASFFFFMPTFMLNGFAFPIRNMPVPVQYLTYLNPVRYFLEITRGVFLKGTGLEALWPQMLALLVFGVTILTVSALRFHKRLD
ncbi:MAG TPA: ABC transporter permease [Bryobacteraceae bacterium]|nr:ABC transporter permease [Bryobacteraceae bacterium]